MWRIKKHICKKNLSQKDSCQEFVVWLLLYFLFSHIFIMDRRRWRKDFCLKRNLAHWEVWGRGTKWHLTARGAMDQDQYCLKTAGVEECFWCLLSQRPWLFTKSLALPSLPWSNTCPGSRQNQWGKVLPFIPTVYYQPFIPAAEAGGSACLWKSSIPSIFLGLCSRLPCIPPDMWGCPWKEQRMQEHVAVLVELIRSAWIPALLQAQLSHTSPPLSFLSKSYLWELKAKWQSPRERGKYSLCL